MDILRVLPAYGFLFFQKVTSENAYRCGLPTEEYLLHEDIQNKPWRAIAAHCCI